MNNIEAFDVATAGGTNQVTVPDLTGTAVRNVHVDLAGSQGMGANSPTS